MKTYTNPLTANIYNVLSPLVGDMMACGVIKSQAQRLGSTEETLTANQIGPLSEGIEQGLVIFLGSDVAKQVGMKIREIK
jgi:hypothetical protein